MVVSSIVQTWKVCDLNVFGLICITYDNRIVFLVCCIGCIWIIGQKRLAQVGKCYSYCSSSLQWISLLCFSFKIFPCLNYPSAFPVLVSWRQKFIFCKFSKCFWLIHVLNHFQEVGLRGLTSKRHMKIVLRWMRERQKLRLICNHKGPHKQFLYTTWFTKSNINQAKPDNNPSQPKFP